ncbi:MAG: 50S ribosomal protein L9 [Alphaproteobacteria bacterium]|jgi:large subunit ribosomal protein L9|nr:50S ribosomal protein L9 [Rhodospirillaceae bacterium]MBT6205597.1 50S ribosomal protein L9 [Rhodospirillaceae bacterium]MBT6512677.1 50S ribosomal protein L9 [Rhodospirillaceae bacterium]MBT7615566.1 50S ribosomal protein L9 [Rhodospirillaceae bacterium]MDG2481294.1 50S ribosomal protein L9 [Alphaproteobacteria bacterium]
MDVVLLERIEKLGHLGEVVAVRPGYARNFLIPQGKALRATKDNVARFEAERAEREANNSERRGASETMASQIEGAHVTLIRQASDNLQLYGSVKARDIADGLIAQGFEISRRNVVLSEPIKTLGLHEVIAALHPEVSVTVIANVARTEDEARIQQETGKVVGREEEEEVVEAAPAVEELVDAEAVDQVAEDLAGNDEASDDADSSEETTAEETSEEDQQV